MTWWKKLLIMAVVVAGIIVLFNSVLMPWYVRHGSLVKVPNVSGMPFEEAVRVLDENGLEGMQGDIRYNQSLPIGNVIEQNPAAELMVKDSRRIYLIVSGGEQLYDVPNLVGRTLREGKFTLDQRNLELVETEQKQSVQYPAGIIISQIEHAGSKVKKGTKISVVISAGMESGEIKVPVIIGKTLEEAKKMLLGAKLTVGKITFQPSTTVPLNTVIDQYPRPNSLAKENQRIDLFVNREQKQKEEPKENENTEEKKDKEDEDKEKKEIDKEKKDTEKKPDVKKDDKSQPDKKDEKKKTEPPKPTDKKDEGGTKF